MIPRKRSERRLSNSRTVSKTIDSITSNVATARIVGLICSRIPDHIWRGIVRCSGLAKNSTATTSSNEVMKANRPPETTPGIINGIWTRLKVVIGPAPRELAARTSDLSNPTSVAVTVIITNGVPRIAPLVITAAGMFFFYSRIHLSQTYLGVIMAHAILGTPFVIITVTATLVGFDKSLVRAANSLGAGPITTFRRVQMPLIIPGVVSGGLFAFITSFDEVVAVLFLASPEQRTIPRQMWSGIREQISPTILAVATLLVILSIVLLTVLELLRRRSERLRGITPS